MKYTINTVKDGFLITIRNMKEYPRGMSRLQQTYDHAIWVAEWFLRKQAPKRVKLKPPMPLSKRFPAPRMYPPGKWGISLKSSIGKHATTSGMAYT